MRTSLIPSKLPKDRASFGCRVLLENVDTGETFNTNCAASEESNIEEAVPSYIPAGAGHYRVKKPSDELVSDRSSRQALL